MPASESKALDEAAFCIKLKDVVGCRGWMDRGTSGPLFFGAVPVALQGGGGSSGGHWNAEPLSGAANKRATPDWEP